MKTRLVLAVLVLMTLACGGTSAVRSLEIIPPDPTRVAPTAPPAVQSLEQELIAGIESEGLTYWGTDPRDQNDCPNDRCIHFGLGSGQDGMSLYIEDGQLVSILSVVDQTDGVRIGEVTGILMSIYWDMTPAEFSCWVDTPIEQFGDCGRYWTDSKIVDGVLYVAVGIADGTTHTSMEA